MRFVQQRQRFRSILEGRDCVVPASVFDPASARIAEELGFQAGMLAGSVAALSVLGAPDLALLTLSELAGQAARISRSGHLPLLVDADHGFGNALNAMRTVEELEMAGAAALTIEDMLLPATFGRSGAQIIPLEESVGKIHASLSARYDKSLAILGRTSAPVITGLEDTISRCKAFEQAGVDGIFVVGLRKRAELEALHSAVAAPIVLGRMEGELTEVAYLGEHGVRLALHGHQPAMAAIQAVYDTLAALRSGTPPGEIKGLASGELLARVTRAGAYKDRMRLFMQSEEASRPGEGQPSETTSL